MTLQIGDTSAWERTFTEEEVRLFAEISGDKGAHHLEKDAEGRLMVHGLLTATLPTKLGGDINFIAREITFQFLRPVFTGETIRCESTLSDVTPTDKYLKLSIHYVCTNQHGKEVLKGTANGVVLHA